MSIELLICVCVGLILFILISLLYIKTLEIQKRLNKFEDITESINIKNYELKKNYELANDNLKKNIEDFKEEIAEEIKSQVDERTISVLNSLKDIEDLIQDFQDEHKTRLNVVEERTKTFTKISSPSIDDEEKKVIQLYEMGKTIPEIAKSLRLGVGRIEFILKLHSEL